MKVGILAQSCILLVIRYSCRIHFLKHTLGVAEIFHIRISNEEYKNKSKKPNCVGGDSEDRQHLVEVKLVDCQRKEK